MESKINIIKILENNTEHWKIWKMICNNCLSYNISNLECLIFEVLSLVIFKIIFQNLYSNVKIVLKFSQLFACYWPITWWLENLIHLFFSYAMCCFKVGIFYCHLLFHCFNLLFWFQMSSTRLNWIQFLDFGCCQHY